MVNELACQWLQWGRDRRQWSTTTVELYRGRIAAADAWMKAQGWAGVTRGKPEHWEQWWSSLPATPSSRNLGRKALVAYGQWLVETKRRAESPAAAIPSWHQHPGQPRPLPPAECRRLLARCVARNDMSCVAVCLLLLTGLRVSEAANLAWRDWDGAWLDVIGKGSRHRRVPTPALLVRVLTRWRPVCTSAVWIFPGPQGALSAQSLRERVKAVVGATPHVARHSYATALLESSRDITVVQGALGHADVKTSMVYAQSSERRLLKAVEALYRDDEAA